jgi:tetratricopeptide (TPR) repeat protein
MAAARLDDSRTENSGRKGGSINSLPATKSFPSQEDRAPAQALWDRIKALPRPRQIGELRRAPADGLWALCEVLCLESQHQCAHDPAAGATLAELALEVADRVTGEAAWRAKVRGLALAHVANALRAQGDLPAAERAFLSADRCWKAGQEARNGLLEEGLLFALKASLRRSQRRFEEEAALLEQASAAATHVKFRVQVLLSRARLAKERGDLEQAVAILLQASETAIPDDDGRVVLSVQHSLADNLSKLDRFPEAEALLPAVIDLSRRCGGQVDLVRLRWIEGRVAAGLGHREEGVATLRKVRGEFAARHMSYDTALVSLELAVLYSEQGRAEEVKTLARHMVPIFQARNVHQEILAALSLFRQAAERERVSAEFARQVLAYLRKARHNPELRFEGELNG